MWAVQINVRHARKEIIPLTELPLEQRQKQLKINHRHALPKHSVQLNLFWRCHFGLKEHVKEPVSW